MKFDEAHPDRKVCSFSCIYGRAPTASCVFSSCRVEAHRELRLDWLGTGGTGTLVRRRSPSQVALCHLGFRTLHLNPLNPYPVHIAWMGQFLYNPPRIVGPYQRATDRFRASEFQYHSTESRAVRRIGALRESGCLNFQKMKILGARRSGISPVGHSTE